MKAYRLFSILDFGFEIESKIGNPKSKMMS